MAQKIASSFPLASIYLVGPIGPRSQALLHPSIQQNNSTRIVQDELHVILEYKQGEILGILLVFLYIVIRYYRRICESFVVSLYYFS